MFHCHHELLEDHTNATLDDVRAELEELEWEEIGYNVPVYLFLAILLLIGIPGNAIVCFVYRAKFPPSTPRFFIIALALFDLLNCVVGMPFEMYDITTDHFLDLPVLCKLVRFSNTFSAFGSISILLIISVDRYKKICRPFRKQILLADARKAVYGIVIASLLFSIPALVVYGSHKIVIHGLDTADCSFDHSLTGNMFPKFYQISLGLLCVATIVVLIVLYGLILYKIFKQKARRATMTSVVRPSASRHAANESNLNNGATTSDKSKSSSMESSKTSSMDKMQQDNTPKRAKTYIRRSRMTFMMLIVTIAFILGYMPHFSLQIARLLINEFIEHLHCDHIGMAFYKFFLRSYFLNSAINPIIYSFYNRRFRQECINLFRRVCCCAKHEVDTLNTETGSES